MMRILWLLLMPFVLFGQHFSETFSDFSRSTATSKYNFNSASLETDLGTGSNNLTAKHFSASFATELTAGSPLIANGSYLNFDGSQWLGSPSTDFNPGTGNFSVEAWIKMADVTPSQTQYIMTKADDANTRWMILIKTTGVIQVYSVVGGAARISCNSDAGAFTGLENKWVHVGVRCVRSDKTYLYVNGAPIAATVTNTMNASAITVTDSMRIGAIQITATTPYDENMAGALYHNSDVGDKWMKDCFLAKNWYSKNEGGIRDAAMRFNQGLANDTLFAALSDSTLPEGYQWTLTWQDSVSAWTDRSYNFTENLSGDSLYFSTTGNNLTVYTDNTTIATIAQGTTTVFIDNISLTTGLIPVTDTGDKGYKETPKFKKFPDWR